MKRKRTYTGLTFFESMAKLKAKINKAMLAFAKQGRSSDTPVSVKEARRVFNWAQEKAEASIKIFEDQLNQKKREQDRTYKDIGGLTSFTGDTLLMKLKLSANERSRIGLTNLIYQAIERLSSRRPIRRRVRRAIRYIKKQLHKDDLAYSDIVPALGGKGRPYHALHIKTIIERLERLKDKDFGGRERKKITLRDIREFYRKTLHAFKDIYRRQKLVLKNHDIIERQSQTENGLTLVDYLYRVVKQASRKELTKVVSQSSKFNTNGENTIHYPVAGTSIRKGFRPTLGMKAKDNILIVDPKYTGSAESTYTNYPLPQESGSALHFKDKTLAGILINAIPFRDGNMVEVKEVYSGAYANLCKTSGMNFNPRTGNGPFTIRAYQRIYKGNFKRPGTLKNKAKTN